MNPKVKQNKEKAYKLLKTGKFSEAKKLLVTVCNKNKKDTESLMMLGYIYSQLNEHDKSIQCLLKVTTISPGRAGVFYNLGNAYKAKGDMLSAVNAYKKAVSISPGFDIYMNLGNCLALIKRFTEAKKYLDLAIAIKPDDANVHYNLGRILFNSGLIEECVPSYNKAIKLDPTLSSAYNNLANAYISLGEAEKARANYDMALSIEPDSLDALCGIVSLLDKSRMFEKANELIEPHLKAKIPHAGLCATFAGFSHYLGQEKQAIEWLETISVSSELSASDKSRLLFLLGKLYDKKKDYQIAFKNYEKANMLIKQDVDLKKMERYFLSIKTIFSKDKLSQYAKTSLQSSRPVFIVGMPRSGTSLVEQIIASHPQVEGAGELEAISSLSEKTKEFFKININYPETVRKLTAYQFEQIGQEYLQKLKKVSSEAQYVTDKMPHNFLHLGFIQLLFPNCKIIHCRRNPVDTCLSIYFQNFIGNHPYSNDLSTVASYYQLYESLMTHWKNNLDLEIFDVDYEQLVANQEKVSKQLIEFCQLEWSEDCLRFNESKRIVATASYDQVRQKIYNKSIDRWRNYESYIQPLISRLT